MHVQPSQQCSTAWMRWQQAWGLTRLLLSPLHRQTPPCRPNCSPTLRLLPRQQQAMVAPSPQCPHRPPLSNQVHRCRMNLAAQPLQQWQNLVCRMCPLLMASAMSWNSLHRRRRLHGVACQLQVTAPVLQSDSHSCRLQSYNATAPFTTRFCLICCNVWAGKPARLAEPAQGTFISLDSGAPPRAAASSAAQPPQQADRAVRASPDAGHVGSASDGAGEVVQLRRQLAEARGQVQSLSGALRSAQAAVKQLQVGSCMHLCRNSASLATATCAGWPC